jgi:hypothetical protein
MKDVLRTSFINPAFAHTLLRERKHMSLFRNYVEPGMRVIASDGEEVGRVTDKRIEGFVVRRIAAPEAVIPYGSIQNVLANEIVLNIPSTEVEAASGKRKT